MSEYLFLGGPANGQTREVTDNGATTKYISLPDAPSFSTLADRSTPNVGGSAAVIHTYARREFRVTDNDDGGREYLRIVYAHESIPSAPHLTNAIMGWLLAQWVMGGQELVNGEVINAEPAGPDRGA